jgi:hypothetical protein
MAMRAALLTAARLEEQLIEIRTERDALAERIRAHDSEVAELRCELKTAMYLNRKLSECCDADQENFDHTRRSTQTLLQTYAKLDV